MPAAVHANPVDLDAYLRECRALVLDDIARRIPRGSRADAVLYDLMMDYPLRPAKGLRPALCIAACRALGGSLEAVLPTAAVLELYHNAFLIHDDVEDGSEKRRDAPTMHRVHGVPIAVNVGDAMLALALGPLLDNMRVLDMGRALRILQVVATMARESAEGQALELDWVRRARWDLTDDDYLAMVDQKTGWYSFVAPMVMGAIAAGADRRAGACRPARLWHAHSGLRSRFRTTCSTSSPASRTTARRSAATSGRASTPSWCSTRCAPARRGPRAGPRRFLAKARPGLTPV